MPSIRELVWAVPDVTLDHSTNILFVLDAVGFNIYSQDHGALLRYIDVNSLPELNAFERGVLKHAATGKLIWFSIRLCAATPAARSRGRQQPGKRSLFLNQLVCNVCIMQENHGVVRCGLGGRDPRDGGQACWGRHIHR